MSTTVILISAYAPPSCIEKYLDKETKWFYSGKDLTRYQLFKEYLEPKIMPMSHPREFQEFAGEMRKPFIDWIESIDNLCGDKIDYWANILYCRNPYQSDLFLYITQVLWVKKFLTSRQGGNRIIVSESIGVLYVLKKLSCEMGFKSILFIGRVYAWNQLIKDCFSMLLDFIKSAASFLIRWLSAYLSKRQGDHILKTDRNLILINTFLSPNEIKRDDHYHDPFLPDLYNWLMRKGWIVAVYPIYYNCHAFSYKGFFQKLRRNATNFVLLEDYIKLSDFIYAFSFPARQILSILNSISTKKPFKLAPDFLRLSMNELVAELLFKGCLNGISAIGLLNYRFSKRLSQDGIKPKVLILWHENQVIHKLIIGGFKKYLPATEVVGVQALVPIKNHLSLFLTDSEKRFNVMPDRIVVTGKSFIDVYSTYQSSIPIKDGPSLRYTYLWALTQKREEEFEKGVLNFNKMCLIFLPQDLSSSKDLLIKTIPVLKNLQKRNISFLLKPHPTNSVDQLVALAQNHGMNLSKDDFTDKNLNDLGNRVTAVISTGSGALLESICLGIPSVFVGPSIGIEMLPFLPINAISLYKIAYTSDEIDEALTEWTLCHPDSMLQRIKDGKKIMEECFNPTNDNTMQVFLPKK